MKKKNAFTSLAISIEIISIVFYVVFSVLMESICKVLPVSHYEGLGRKVKRHTQFAFAFASFVCVVWVTLSGFWVMIFGAAVPADRVTRIGHDSLTQISLSLANLSATGYIVVGLMILYFIYFVKLNKEMISSAYEDVNNWLIKTIANG